jgi:hypothetical protein
VQQQLDLFDGLAVAALGGVLLLGIAHSEVVERGLGLVALAHGAVEQLAPAPKGGIEGIDRAAQHARAKSFRALVPGRLLRAELGREVAQDRQRLGLGMAAHFRLSESVDQLLAHRQAGLLGLHHVGNCLAERLTAGGEPDRLQVAFEQLTVGQVDQGRAHLAVHHLPRLAEEELVVRAARGTVGDHQRCLATAPGAAGALGVVGRRGRHVAQIDGIERRDVDAELHRRRAVEHRQKARALAEELCAVAQLAVQGFAILVTVAKARLANLAHARFDLGGVLAALEAEDGGAARLQGLRQGAVELGEKGVGAAACERAVAGEQAHALGGEPPAGGAKRRGVVTAHELAARGAEHPLQQLAVGIAPERLVHAPQRAWRSALPSGLCRPARRIRSSSRPWR